MAHLDREALLALAESREPVPAGHHAAVCEACRRELASLRRTLADVRDVEVPEPSPLFWDHFSARVRDAVSREPAPRRGTWVHWLRPSWALTLGAATAAAVLAIFLVARPPSPPTATNEVATVVPVDDGDSSVTPDLPAGEDWDLVADVAGDLDVDQVEAMGAGVVPGAADAAVLQLTADERGELVRIIREEMGKERSS